ncbi:hypothetical protein Mal4_34590 [Maioricimonas rarisocia]|uniref:Uncharacterized protein n=1 Tax=Maioricimonas rarisocia TaxID=2528026 RepID=A0A517Z9G2_9PLAN|nr:hypothetical protein [Maioricimonas rarisocia]QDU39124.1 hypothetical protein Mal4_34590 [Maioricimonas rarisocia]
MNSPSKNDDTKQGTNPPEAGASNEMPCPDCGEMVRKGLLRCWNCGAFMDKGIEARFQEMQENPAPMIFSEAPEDDEPVSVETTQMVTSASDDDFQLDGSIGTVLPAEDQTDAAEEDDAGDVEQPGGVAGAESTGETAGDDQEKAGVAHSVATGGDALLEVALQEEAEARKRRKKQRRVVGGMRTPGGFIIFCPYGCKMEVKDQNRGMTGRCPRCGAPFIVPVDPPQFKSQKSEKAEAEKAAVETDFQAWMEALHVHTVNPEKLKLKADSLTKEFVPTDFAFGKDELVLLVLGKKGGGLFGGGGGKAEELREAAQAHLREGKPVDQVPDAEVTKIEADTLSQLRVVQPVESRAHSLFAGIPVFGAGRIAIQLPLQEDSTETRYVSMGLTEFREFARQLEEKYGLTGLADKTGIPMEDEFETHRCHYSSVAVKALKHLEFYQADPKVEPVVAGWKCGACGIVVSEDARNKEKLGGKGGKGLAKTKCPKCQQKFGDNPLYSLAEVTESPSMSGTDSGSDADANQEPAATDAAKS